jgi:glycerol kinase
VTTHAANSLVAAIDQGTTSSRCILFDRGGRIVASHQLEHRQITPRPGWVEHDPDEIIERVRTCIRVALRDAGTDASSLTAVGITNQRETTVVWDRRTGRAVHPAIVWQDTGRRTPSPRSAISIDSARTGFLFSTYSSALKLRWILEHMDGASAPAADSGDLLFGTIDTYLVWHLTGGADHGVHVTDVTNASRTMLMDLETLDWDPGICAELGIPMAMLPEIRGSSEVTGGA